MTSNYEKALSPHTNEVGAIAHAILAVADSINELALRTNTEHEHITTLGSNTCMRCGAPLEEQEPPQENNHYGLNEQELHDAIEALAEQLWKHDTGYTSPAQRFQDDYTHQQDRYRGLARVALGLTDEPKDPRP